MGFGEAVRTVLSKYADFSGRARRSEFWYWILFMFIVSAVAAALDSLLHLDFKNSTGGRQGGWIEIIATLALIIPSIAVQFRRLHDVGRSGWWWVLHLVCCIGTILVFIFSLTDSQPGANQYGPNPKGA